MDSRLVQITPSRLFNAIADFLLPRVCVVCGRTLLPSEDIICLGCLADLPLSRNWEKLHNRMADLYNSRIEAESYQAAVSLFFYREGQPHSSITQALKYKRNLKAGRRFAMMLAEKISEAPWFSDVDAVVPVPLHPSRLRRRGYNQAGIIAAELASRLGAQYLPGALERVKKTRTQTELSGEDKRRNVDGAFCAANLPELHHILLVDDVFTSGSTASQCHAALRKVCAGGVKISVACLASVNND